MLLILGCSMLFATRSWIALISDLSDHPHRLLIPGLAAMMYGLIVIFKHNIWISGWELVVTVTGWVILIKGLTFLFLPDVVSIHQRFPEPLKKMILRVGGSILILLSIMVLLTVTGRA